MWSMIPNAVFIAVSSAATIEAFLGSAILWLSPPMNSTVDRHEVLVHTADQAFLQLLFQLSQGCRNCLSHVRNASLGSSNNTTMPSIDFACTFMFTLHIVSCLFYGIHWCLTIRSYKIVKLEYWFAICLAQFGCVTISDSRAMLSTFKVAG